MHWLQGFQYSYAIVLYAEFPEVSYPETKENLHKRTALAERARGPYMLRKPFMVVFFRLRVLALCLHFRFEMLHQTWECPATMNREHQHGAK